jgi:tetratricopeptide (TPR) repeat protein
LYDKNSKFRPIIVKTLLALAEILKLKNDGRGALDAAEEAVKIARECMAADSPALAQALTVLAGLLIASRRRKGVVDLYTEAIGIYRTVYGADHPTVGSELLWLGKAQETFNELRMAEKTMAHGVAILRKAGEKYRIRLAEGIAMLANLKKRLSKHPEAVELYREAITIRKAINVDDPQLAFLNHKLGEVLSVMQSPDAEAYFLLSIEQFRSDIPEGVTDAQEQIARGSLRNILFMTDVLDDLGLFYLSFHHYEKAEKCFSESLDLRMKNVGPSHPTIAFAYSNFSLLHLHRESYEDCVKMGRAALDMYKGWHEQNTQLSLAIADAQLTLGNCALRQNKLNDALTYFEEAESTRKKYNESLAAAEAASRVARVLVGLKRFKAAVRKISEARRLVAEFDPSVVQSIKEDLKDIESRIPDPSQWGPQDPQLEGAPS